MNNDNMNNDNNNEVEKKKWDCPEHLKIITNCPEQCFNKKTFEKAKSVNNKCYIKKYKCKQKRRIIVFIVGCYMEDKCTFFQKHIKIETSIIVFSISVICFTLKH